MTRAEVVARAGRRVAGGPGGARVEQAARERYRRLRWAVITALAVATAALITLGALRRADRAWAAARTAVRDHADAERRFQAADAARQRDVAPRGPPDGPLCE
ncbi:MAG: hypothetical protein IPH44_15900 [Myxococcales bacterium]|jgi:hypothetical protein|nr:hypothetical protein [Myxococcales bacterium]MBK7195680.1 hypothetical protein [Myxococcales bacterium]